MDGKKAIKSERRRGKAKKEGEKNERTNPTLKKKGDKARIKTALSGQKGIICNYCTRDVRVPFGGWGGWKCGWTEGRTSQQRQKEQANKQKRTAHKTADRNRIASRAKGRPRRNREEEEQDVAQECVNQKTLPRRRQGVRVDGGRGMRVQRGVN